MLVLAHRGYHQQAPENTLAAFAAAAAHGVDGIETDLRLSADGQIVLFHDRVAPDGREVAATAHDELCRLVGYAVPTLRQALAAQPGLLWNLELKTPAVLDAALPIIAEFSRQHRLLVTSFWHNLIDAVRCRLNVPCGLLEANRPAALSPLLADLQDTRGASSVAAPIGTMVWSFEMIDPVLLAAARAQGVHNWAYGLQTPADHQRARELQLDAVITDRPEFLPPVA